MTNNIKSNLLKIIAHSRFLRALLRLRKVKGNDLHRDVAGLWLESPFGSSLGCDKQFDHYNALSALGASFVLSGPVSAKPEAISETVRHAIDKLQKHKPEVVVGGCITDYGTELPTVIRNYDSSFSILYDFVDFIVVCPPVNMQQANFDDAVTDISDSLLSLRLFYDQYKPIFLQIPASVSHAQLVELLDYCMASGVDGVVVDKAMVQTVAQASQSRLCIIATVDKDIEAKETFKLLNEGASLIALGSEDKFPGVSDFRRNLVQFKK